MDRADLSGSCWETAAITEPQGYILFFLTLTEHCVSCSHCVLVSPNMHVIPLGRLRLREGTVEASALRSGGMRETPPGRAYLPRHVGDLLHLGAPLQYALILVNERGVWRGKPLQRSLILSK